MSIYKHRMRRLCLIDSAIRTLHKPSKEMIRKHVCQGLSLEDDGICISTIEKDLNYMRMDMDAPIKYNHTKGYHYLRTYNFIFAFLRYWSAYMVLPPEIEKLIFSEEEE